MSLYPRLLTWDNWTTVDMGTGEEPFIYTISSGSHFNDCVSKSTNPTLRQVSYISFFLSHFGFLFVKEQKTLNNATKCSDQTDRPVDTD